MEGSRPRAERPGARGRRRSLSAALALTLALAGCGAEDPSPSRSRVEAAIGAERALAPGAWQLEISNGRIDWRANRAQPGALLRDLATQLDFAVALEETLEGPLSLALRDASLPETLSALLGDRVYRAHWAYDWRERRHRLERLAVGAAAQQEAPARAPARTAPDLTANERIALLREHTQQRAEALRAERLRPRERVDLDEVLAGLDSASPRERTRSVLQIEPEGEGLWVLLDVLASDPEPEVRSAAVTQLEDADGFAGVRGLLRALHDPDRGVVLDAIEALEFAGDETVIPALAPLSESPDAEVRRAALEAAEFLRD